MAKTTGMGWTTLSVDNSAGTPQDIRNDVMDFDFATPRAVQEVTGVDLSAHERLLLLADFSITLKGVFNPAANKSHSVFRDVATTSVMRTTSLVVAGQTLGPEVFYTDYKMGRAESGAFTWSAPGVLANGVAPTWS